MASQEYFTAAGDDLHTAKKRAEAFRFNLDAEYMHVITLMAAVLGALVPSLVFNASPRVSVQILGFTVILAVIVGLWLTKTYKRKAFVIGYTIVAIPAAFLVWLGMFAYAVG